MAAPKSTLVPDGARTAEEVDAEVDRLREEARRNSAEARKFDAEAAKTEIELKKLERAEKAELARDLYYKIYVFDSAVGPKSVEQCIKQLAEWSRVDPKCEIEIIFNSPGGSVIDGMALFDYIQRIRRLEHKVTCSTYGYAASMAGILLQAGDVRRMGPEAWLLIHEGSFGAMGSVGEVEDTVEWVKRIGERILDIFDKRIRASSAPSKLSRTQLKNKMKRKDLWISSDEALDWGLIDEVA